MEEKSTNAQTENTEQIAPETTPAPTAGNTPPQAATVDIEAITRQAVEKATEAAEKKQEAVFKSMLEQQGLDADSINKMVADWKSKQRTPETELAEAKEQLAAEQSKVQKLVQEKAVLAKGIPDDKASKYLKLAMAYMDEKTDFAAALVLALADFPIAQDPPPVYAAGPGSQRLDGEQDEFQKRMSKYK